MVALFRQTRQGGEWNMIWCLRRHHIIHDVGSLCISTMWLLNFFLVERTLKQELQVMETSGTRDQGDFDHQGLLHHHAVLHILLIPPLPCISFSSSSSSFFSSSTSSFSSSFRRFGRPPGLPSSHAGTCRTVTLMSAHRPGLLLLLDSKQ